MTARKWPLGSRDADEAAHRVAAALAKWPDVQRRMHRRLSARFIGAENIDDMHRILLEVRAEIRETLPS